MKKKSTALRVLCAFTILSAFFSCRKSNVLTNDQPDLSVNPKVKTESLNSNLIAYWPLVSNANDLTGNGNNGTATNISYSTLSRFNSNYTSSFNGASSYITVPDNAALRLNNTDFTLNAWVKMRSYNSSYGSSILSKHTTGINTGWTWSITGSASPTKGLLFFGPGGGSVNATGTKLIDTNWHMITTSYSYALGQVKLYVDGVADSPVNGVASPSASITQALYLGRDSYSSSYYLDGSLQDVRIYNKLLDSVSIKGLYREPNPSNLIAYWSFDGNAIDYSGHGNNGTASGVTSTTDRFGNTTGAYHFNGTSSYVTVPDNVSLRLSGTDFTLNSWIKLDSYNASYGSSIFSKHVAGADNGWTWSVTGNATSPTGKLFFGPGGGSSNVTGTGTISTGAWHMVTTVYSYSTHQIKMYIDGVLDTTSATSIASPNSSITSPLYIGRDSYGSMYYFNGSLDDMRIYTGALTPSQITQLYSAVY